MIDLSKYPNGMTVTNVTALREQTSDVLDAAENGPVLIQRNSKPVAVLVSHEDYEGGEKDEGGPDVTDDPK